MVCYYLWYRCRQEGEESNEDVSPDRCKMKKNREREPQIETQKDKKKTFENRRNQMPRIYP